MIKLTEWEFSRTFEGKVQAHGYVTGHHRLKDGDWIHTSQVMSLEEGENGSTLIMHTYSGSHYELSVKEVNPFEFEETYEIVKKMGISEKTCLIMKEQVDGKAEQMKTVAEEKLGKCELYLIMCGINAYKAFWKDADGSIREVAIHCHSGMFQDSMLVTDWEQGKVDFRYFPKWGEMEPYHWSDGLEAVWVYNMSDSDICFVGTQERISCPGRECVRIDKSAYTGEGLMSPDVVNGKSMLSSMLSKEKKK